MDIFNENGITVRGVISTPHDGFMEVENEEDAEVWGIYAENAEGLRMWVMDFDKTDRDEALEEARTMAETRAIGNDQLRVSKAVDDWFQKLQEGIKTANEIRQVVNINPVRDKVDIFQDYGGDWRWRRVSAWSNKIIAVSGEVYSEKSHAIEMAERVNLGPYELEIED